ncbi:jg23656 [Pararge aegeria aegeria]|uniref:Jg23656 protein n=1 Tax=Pararge aegeria aegeria TaxID=348720 RepID=A0A8S4QCV1_9NEOP|nr:jg23656 [Pararge aegeria aegeria]
MCLNICVQNPPPGVEHARPPRHHAPPPEPRRQDEVQVTTTHLFTPSFIQLTSVEKGNSPNCITTIMPTNHIPYVQELRKFGQEFKLVSSPAPSAPPPQAPPPQPQPQLQPQPQPQPQPPVVSMPPPVFIVHFNCFLNI